MRFTAGGMVPFEIVRAGSGIAGPGGLSPLALAYIGDGVFELFVRTALVSSGQQDPNQLHEAASRLARAEAQASMVHSILPHLSEEEADIVRRGRNAKPGHAPKSAPVTAYRYSTGLEALLGYLFLSGRSERLLEILGMCMEIGTNLVGGGDGDGQGPGAQGHERHEGQEGH